MNALRLAKPPVKLRSHGALRTTFL